MGHVPLVHEVPVSIETFQLLTAAAWFITSLFMTPGTYRAFFGTPARGDFAKSGFFFVALVMVGGCARFLVAPGDLLTWKLIYSLSILTAAYVLVLAWNMRRDHAGS
jgi:hypothetical protein